MTTIEFHLATGEIRKLSNTRHNQVIINYITDTIGNNYVALLYLLAPLRRRLYYTFDKNLDFEM